MKICAAALGDGCFGHTVDVVDEMAVDRTFAAIHQREGRIDILVNNAGTAIRRPTNDPSLSDWQKVVDVNMSGSFLCARAAGRVMTRQGSGAIINVASIMGLSGGGLYRTHAYQKREGDSNQLGSRDAD